MKILKFLKIILNIILTTIIIFGICFVGLFCIGVQPYVVESGSMEPTIKTGSISFINKHAKYQDIVVGDIIAFEIEDGVYATHRVVSINKEGITTKGDANSMEDAIITTEDTFLGKNIFSIPKCGIIVKKLQTTSGKIMLGTIIIVLFTAAILIGEPKKKKKD